MIGQIMLHERKVFKKRVHIIHRQMMISGQVTGLSIFDLVSNYSAYTLRRFEKGVRKSMLE